MIETENRPSQKHAESFISFFGDYTLVDDSHTVHFVSDRLFNKTPT